MRRKKGKNNFFKNVYSDAWNYLKESRSFIYAIISIFVFSIILGFFVPVPESIFNQIIEFIRELIEKTEGMNQYELIRFIFLNNLQSSFMGMILGIFLGVFPLIATITNGYILGFVASLSVDAEGVFVLWRLLPHGIFELPAIFISLALGLRLGTFIFEEKKIETLKKNFFESLKVFVFVVVPLLVTAAIIEGILIFATR